MRRGQPLLLASAAALMCAACSSAAGSAPPTWQPSPTNAIEGPGGVFTPIVPVPTPAGGGAAGTAPGAGRAPSAVDPLVVATHLSAPVGLTMMPDGTALVGERSTGRIVRVEPVAGRPVRTVRVLSGLDTSGDGGLLDLALSPGYAENNLIYAYLTTRTDNRVVDFTLTGPVTPVLTGIPKGRRDNTGRIAFDAAGNLFVGTGDAGRPALAESAQSLAGKVLRVDSIGDPVRTNPDPRSPRWTSGHEVVDGLCPTRQPGQVLEVQGGLPGSAGEVNVLTPGADYGAAGAARPPAATLPLAYRSPGGCAVQAGRLWVTSLDGQALLSAPLTVHGSTVKVGAFVAILTNTYGRLRTVVAAPDGALWLTTSNRDGKGRPVAADERVIRYVPSSAAAESPY